MNPRDTARAYAHTLRSGGSAEPEIEAEVLVRFANGLTREQFFAGTPGTKAPVAGLMERRSRGEPLAYLTGEREFYGRTFRVGPGVLIPRPETELLVELALEFERDNPGATIVDVGTGSGCIAVSIALERRSSGLTIATDVSARAVEFAIENARAHSAGLDVIHGTLLQPVGRADTVVANLPYIPCGEIQGLQREIVEHEPRIALDGGSDGLEVIAALVQDCATRVRPRFLALEVGAGQAQQVAALLTDGAAHDISFHRDLAGIERVVTARWLPE